jgi:CRP-like cAMP-binding protein
MITGSRWPPAYGARIDEARIAAIPLFAGLPPADRAAVAEVAGPYEVDAGIALTSEGDFGHGFFAIEEGTAEVLQNGTRIATLGPGDVFGEIALVASGRRTASVVATSPMRLITIFKRDLWRLEEQCPELADALRLTTLERLQPGATRDPAFPAALD